MTTVTLTNRNRIGYGVSTQPIEIRHADGTSYPSIAAVTQPDMVGTPRQVRERMQQDGRWIGSAWHSTALFYQGKRILRVVAPSFAIDSFGDVTNDLFHNLDEDGRVTVEIE